jgi:hypothetical protein
MLPGSVSSYAEPNIAASFQPLKKAPEDEDEHP